MGKKKKTKKNSEPPYIFPRWSSQAFVNSSWRSRGQEKECSKKHWITFLTQSRCIWICTRKGTYQVLCQHVYKVDKESVNTVISQTGLYPRSTTKERFGSFQRVQGKRVGTAAAILLADPRFLILGRTNHVGTPINCGKLRKLLRKWKKKGPFCFHARMTDGRRSVCDRVHCIINKGNLSGRHKTFRITGGRTKYW